MCLSFQSDFHSVILVWNLDQNKIEKICVFIWKLYVLSLARFWNSCIYFDVQWSGTTVYHEIFFKLIRKFLSVVFLYFVQRKMFAFAWFDQNIFSASSVNNSQSIYRGMKCATYSPYKSSHVPWKQWVYFASYRFVVSNRFFKLIFLILASLINVNLYLENF